MESLSDECHAKKKAKTSSSVRFAVETPSDAAENVLEDVDSLSSNVEDIKLEIRSFLPSSASLYRRKPVVEGLKASTFPRASSSKYSHTFSRTRRRSYVLQRKKSSSPSTSRLHAATLTEVLEKNEKLSALLNDEEKVNELSAIRNIPIQMNKKKQYREALLDSISTPDSAYGSWQLKFKDNCSSFFKRVFSRFELWPKTLKQIEGQFGTGVVSYFVFLRWLIILNTMIFILYFIFVIFPHVTFDHSPKTKINLAPKNSMVNDDFLNKFRNLEDVKFESKERGLQNLSSINNEDILSNLGTLLDHYLPDEITDLTISYDKRNLTFEEHHNLSIYCEAKYASSGQNTSSEIFFVIQDFLQGTGWMQSTVLFLGSYPASDISYFGFNYNLPMAFLCVLFFSLFLCLCMMLQYSSLAVQENILSRKSNYLVYSNILFCSWDYCIEDEKSAITRHKSILREIKSNLAEERRKLEVKQWSTAQKIKVCSLRIFFNTFVLLSLLGSYYLIYRVVKFQLKQQQLHLLNIPGVNTFFVQYLSPLVITVLNIVVPCIFQSIVKFEMYSTQTEINIALFRIVFLRLSSVFVLVSSLYQQITCEPKDMCGEGMLATCSSPLCWETYVGQQLYKLAITDFFVYVCIFLGYDLLRDLIVQRCKNPVTRFIGRQVFDLPNQVLSLVYSQTLCWLGFFYSPLLPAITVIKFGILFYLKKVMVLKHCIPAPIHYKASRSNAIFIVILMLSFFAVAIIHGYCLTSIEPSSGCSPFRYYYVMMHVIPDTMHDWSPKFNSFLNAIFSGIFFFPAIIILCLAIYYYWTRIIAHRRMIKVLKAQIMLEGRDKQFLLNRLAAAASRKMSSQTHIA